MSHREMDRKHLFRNMWGFYTSFTVNTQYRSSKPRVKNKSVVNSSDHRTATSSTEPSPSPEESASPSVPHVYPGVHVQQLPLVVSGVLVVSIPGLLLAYTHWEDKLLG